MRTQSVTWSTLLSRDSRLCRTKQHATSIYHHLGWSLVVHIPTTTTEPVDRAMPSDVEHVCSNLHPANILPRKSFNGIENLIVFTSLPH